MSKSLSEKYDEEVLERLRVVEHRSINNEQRSQTNKEDLARAVKVGNVQGQIEGNGNLPLQEGLSDNEKCLVYMYRYLIANQDDDKELCLRVDNRGYMELGFG